MTHCPRSLRGSLILAASVCSAFAQQVVGGPFVVNDSTRSATIAWIVRDSDVTVQSAGGEAKTSPVLRVEKTTLTGLEPSKKYDYTVPGHADLKGSFKTAPAPTAKEPYTFVVYGDTRTRHDVHRRVIGELMKHGIPDFIIHTGDLVADGNDSSLWPIFFDIEKDLLSKTAFFPSLGNHERNTRYFGEIFQAEAPYYSFDWGNSHFIVLNSDIPNSAPSPRMRDLFWAEQTKWLEDDLASHQKADHRFVVAHHPPFTAVFRRQGENEHMAALIPMLEKYHVTAGLFGHDHNYQHYVKNGIHYIGTGGGGAPLYDVDKPPAGITRKVLSVENFVTISVNGKSVHARATAIDGQTIEEFDIP